MINTYMLTITYRDSDGQMKEIVHRNISRVAAERYTDYYRTTLDWLSFNTAHEPLTTH